MLSAVLSAGRAAAVCEVPAAPFVISHSKCLRCDHGRNTLLLAVDAPKRPQGRGGFFSESWDCVRGLQNPDQSYGRTSLVRMLPIGVGGGAAECNGALSAPLRRTHLAVRLRTLPLWPGSGVLSSGGNP